MVGILFFHLNSFQRLSPLGSEGQERSRREAEAIPGLMQKAQRRK
jgi:hypothetical protein